MKNLELVMMGIDFETVKEMEMAKVSDCEGFRLETRRDLIKGKDGNHYFISFNAGNEYRKGKKGKLEKVREDKLWVQIDIMESETEDYWYGNADLEKKVSDMNLSYRKADILTVANMIAAEPYDSVVVYRR